MNNYFDQLYEVPDVDDHLEHEFDVEGDMQWMEFNHEYGFKGKIEWV